MVRTALALASVSACAWSVALARSGAPWIVASFGMAADVAVVVFGSALGAAIRGRTFAARIQFAPAFLLYGASLTIATALYLGARSRLVLFELMIPALISIALFWPLYRTIRDR